jgi:hypothetical protein
MELVLVLAADPGRPFRPITTSSDQCLASVGWCGRKGPLLPTHRLNRTQKGATIARMWVNHLVQLLSKSWQGRLILAVIAVVSVCVSVFEPYSFPRPVAEWRTVAPGFPGGHVVKSLGNLGIVFFTLIVLVSVAALLLDKLGLLFAWFDDKHNEYKRIGSLEDIIGFVFGCGIIPAVACGFLVEYFGVDRNVGFTFVFAVWGLILATGVAVFFLAAGEDQSPSQPQTEEVEKNRIVMPGDKDFRMPGRD